MEFEFEFAFILPAYNEQNYTKAVINNIKKKLIFIL